MVNKNDEWSNLNYNIWLSCITTTTNFNHLPLDHIRLTKRFAHQHFGYILIMPNYIIWMGEKSDLLSTIFEWNRIHQLACEWIYSDTFCLWFQMNLSSNSVAGGLTIEIWVSIVWIELWTVNVLNSKTASFTFGSLANLGIICKRGKIKWANLDLKPPKNRSKNSYRFEENCPKFLVTNFFFALICETGEKG